MRRIILALVWSFSLGTAHAQTVVPAPQLLMPNPLGIVLMIGKWMFDSERQLVYYIEVEGQGTTINESRENGFRLAVEQAVGSVMSSSSTAENGKLANDQIIVYSAGYIDKYEIMSTTTSGSIVKTKMKVWVRKSAISNRLLNKSENTTQLDGDRAAVSYNSLARERKNGDALVKSVIDDLHTRGFDVTVRSTRIEFSEYRQADFYVNFLLEWNADYIDSLDEAFAAVAEKNSNSPYFVSINKPSFFSFANTYRFSDPYKVRMLQSAVYGQTPKLLLTLKDNTGTILYQDVFRLENFHNKMAAYSGAGIDGAGKIRGRLLVEGLNPYILKQITTVELKTV